jgi:hypothetical protein
MMSSRCANQTQRLAWERYRTSGETSFTRRSKEAKGGPTNALLLVADKYDTNVISTATQFAEIAPTNAGS